MIEENVVASAGTVHYLTLEQIRDAIRELGYEPRQRNVRYELIDGLQGNGLQANGRQGSPGPGAEKSGANSIPLPILPASARP
jgi:cyclic dehypoxanthinyl futalosine synthase